jgi:NAD(P)-dependent dehydrogenase (short-subunit alcohol dehydrogenase family)
MTTEGHTTTPPAAGPTGAPQYASYPSLRGRTVFVTGGATGIGAEFVAQFARQGALVGFVDIQAEAAAKLAAGIAADQGTAPWHQACDVSDVPRLRDAIGACATALGAIDVLINNAADDERRPVEEMTEQFWDEKFGVNLRPMFFAAQAVAPAMRARRRGSIINLGSITWHAGFANVAAYATAKAGIEGLTRSLARDLGADGIRVNCLIPGWTMTERQLAGWVTPEAEREIDRAQCLPGRLLPADIARMALWLAADDSRMCTGQTWVVDGGWI